jgi:hypothetical protein
MPHSNAKLCSESERQKRILALAVAGMSALGVIAMMVQWVKEGWLTRWWTPHDPVLTLLLCGFVGAWVGLLSAPCVIPCLRRTDLRKSVIIVYGLNAVVVCWYVLAKPTSLTGPLSAAVVALIGVCGLAWILKAVSEGLPRALPRFGWRLFFLFIALAAIVCLILATWERSTRGSRLIKAAYRGDLSSVRNLISYGADVHARDGWSGTPLMYAASWGHGEIVAELLQSGAAVNGRSRMRQTPLMHAAASGHKIIVEHLIACGADKTLLDEDGRSATDLARKHGYAQLASYIDSAAD